MKIRNIASAAAAAVIAVSVAGACAFAETADVNTTESFSTVESAESTEAASAENTEEAAAETAEVTVEVTVEVTATAATAESPVLADEEKGSPSTGVEGVAVAVAAIILAGAGIAMSRKQ